MEEQTNTETNHAESCDTIRLELFDVVSVRHKGDERWLGRAKWSGWPNGKAIAIFKINEELIAIPALCPHEAFNMAYADHVGGYEIECPIHGNRYTLRDGNLLSYHVEIEDDKLFIVLPK